VGALAVSASGPAGWLLRRLLAAVALLFVVATATFVLLHALPGDPTDLLLDPRVPESSRVELRRLWGLDEPVATQYGRWLTAVARGDWGTSFVHRRPVRAVVAGALPYTLALGGAALLVQLVTALPLGMLAARRPGRALDQVLRAGSLLLYSLPTFWLGLMALLLLAYRWPLFPAGHARAAGDTGGGVASLLAHLALPALVLGLSAAGGLLRLARGSFLEALHAEPLRAARARGVPEARVVWLHGARQAAGPVIQLLGLTLPGLFAGALVVEVVFSWPGLGRVTYLALRQQDVALALACTAWSAALAIAGTLLADLLAAAADPRQRQRLWGGPAGA
jgi:peptide/nickel transport system permease protein